MWAGRRHGPELPAGFACRRVPAHGYSEQSAISWAHGGVIHRRIDDLALLNTELAAWQAAVNADQRQVNWHFTTDDARTKLRHLYPKR